MECPYCNKNAGRMTIHHHMVESHRDEIDIDIENRLFRYGCPECEIEAEVEPGTGVEDAEDIEKFQREITMMMFDKLLNHLESNHGY